MTSDSITTGAAVAERTPTSSSPRIADLVTVAATRLPQAPALIVTADRIAITYQRLLGLVDELAGQLTRAGLMPGDRVGLRTASTAEFVVGLLAASRADLIAVPLDPALPISDQRARSEAVGARAVLTDGTGPGDKAEPSVHWWPIAVSFDSDGGAPSVSLDAGAGLKAEVTAPEGLHPDDAMIMFTGGTTGLPKMVPWTHGNLAASVRAIVAGYRLGPRDATVAVMPLYHGHGLVAALLSSLASGGEVLLPARGRFSAHTFWDDIEAVGATWYTAVPTIHQILLERAAAESSAGKKAALRFIRSCSAPLTPETAQALQAEFSAPVLCAFGMTESTHQVCSTGLDQDENPAESTGLVGPSTGPEIRIAGPDGAPLPDGEVGEVWLRGDTVVRGYLGDPKITAANFTDGWLRTGDLGSVSSAGLSIRGRIKELINRGGEKISPERVEGILATHPNVMEAAVFGIAHRIYGEAVAAALVSRGTAPTPEELTEFCRERLAPYEIPDSFEITAELPHTPKGSLDRRAVAQQFGGK
ncbi:FadD7 family fatty acid--CoA ligase [Mycobacterium angelicum]|uniref:Acyl-CoA synthetase n=1 Tax=Mycobacterium angelicum TaxID=470074 RepID=A0A1W9ZTJ2_MYCAN|nr:FadD7 family fatty acid--CoA ligase [Mycobacterium angelicum]MCV7199221.1 fatty acid--CoA ligase family protein [Mycobacterium angelicum]ORA21110.1 acyl-CoA synthetase [Mycobacterium angelicum]